MIIYLASYPRSGNSWLQRIFSYYFGIDYANFYREGSSKINLEMVNNSLIGDLFIKTRDKTRLADNCGLALTPEFRKLIASEDNVYLIKTHELPYTEYYKGEYIIYIIRHPGAVVWSYYNFKKDFGSFSGSIEEIIIGDSFVGSWSNHIQTWQKFGKENSSCYYELKYEEMNPTAEFLNNLKKFFNLEIQNQEKQFPGFEYWHEKSPIMFREGLKNDWVSHLSINQILLLWLVNDEAIKNNKYDFSAFDNDFEQNLCSMLLDHSAIIFENIRKEQYGEIILKLKNKINSISGKLFI